MARPKKKTVDYFPHQTTHGKTMFILESRWGNDGYSFWFKLLEILGSKELMIVDCNNSADWHFLIAKTNLNEETATEILNCLSELEAINPEFWAKKIIYSQNFVDGVSDAFKRRKEHLPTLKRVSAYINPAKGTKVQTLMGKGKGKGKERDIKPPCQKYKYSDDDMVLAKYISQRITEVGLRKPSNIEKQANSIRLMREQDNRVHEEIKAVFDWANRNDFWQTNIRSVEKLRTQYDVLNLKRNKVTPYDAKKKAKQEAIDQEVLDMGGYWDVS